MTLADLLATYGPSLWKGFVTTVILSVVSILAATPLAILIAILRDSGPRIVALPLAIFVNVFRLLPALLVLFFAFYATPQLGLRLTPLTAALAGLTIIGAAYMSEDIRGGLAAVSSGQWRAARALGLGPLHTLRRIVAPQAVAIVIPPYVTRAIIMVKGTSLASFVSVGELTAATSRATSVTYEPFVFFFIAGALYLFLSGTLALFQVWAERFVARRYRLARPGT